MSTGIKATVFHAAIRQTQGGLSQGSNGDGIILQLDIPESEPCADLFAELMRMRRTELVVTVMPAQQVKQAVREEQAEAEKVQPVQTVAQSEADSQQVINGKAWSLLLHKRGFARCPGVWDLIGNHEGADEHEKMRSYFNVEHLREVRQGRALAAFVSPNAQTMIEQAWRDASR